MFGAAAEVFKGYADTLGKLAEAKARILELEAALRDCMSYVDVDNLTMQTKERNWRAVLDGGKWNPANVEIEPPDEN